MRFDFRKNKPKPARNLDITPLIDVVFLLLIFFMLTSNYVLQAGIRVELPNAIEAITMPASRVEVYITAHDIIYCRGKEITSQELLLTLKGLTLQYDAVLIFADVDSRHGKVVEVEDICKRSGFRNISVATQPVTMEPKPPDDK